MTTENTMSPREIRRRKREIRRQMRIFRKSLKNGKTPLEAAKDLVNTYAPENIQNPSTSKANHKRLKSRQVALNLISRVESEKKSLETQIKNLKASGGCSGCRRNALKNLEKRLEFFTQIDSQIRR